MRQVQNISSNKINKKNNESKFKLFFFVVTKNLSKIWFSFSVLAFFPEVNSIFLWIRILDLNFLNEMFEKCSRKINV